jgi:hypothetical protein
MSPRVPTPRALALVFALLLLPFVANAAPAKKPAGGSAHSVGSGPRQRERGSSTASRGSRLQAPGSSRTSPTTSDRPKVAPRTLDDIHIEGEIPVPQVLFITARDQRRFLEFQHHRYRRTSLELGRATPTPSRIVVTAPSSTPRKESE